MATITFVQPQEPEALELQALDSNGCTLAVRSTSSHGDDATPQDHEISIEAPQQISIDDQTGASCRIVALEQAAGSESVNQEESDTQLAPACPVQPVPNPNLDRWQLRLNATQTVLAFIGLPFLCVTIYLAFFDHRVNRDSWKLDRWTASNYFRDECQALMNTTAVLTDDCKEALEEPLRKPPTLMAKFLLRRGLHGVSEALLAAHHGSFQLLIATSTNGRLVIVVGLFILTSLLAGAGFLGRRRRHPSIASETGGMAQIPSIPSWVGNSLSRSVGPIQTACTTGVEATATSLRLRRKSSEENFSGDWEDALLGSFISKDWGSTVLEDALDNPVSVDTQIENLSKTTGSAGASDDIKSSAPSTEMLHSSTPKLLEDSVDDTSNPTVQVNPADEPLSSTMVPKRASIEEIDNQDVGEDDEESEWLPTVDDAENRPIYAPSKKLFKVVDFVMDRLMALGYETFAFDFLRPRENVSEYFGRRGDLENLLVTKGTQSSTFAENLSTKCSAFPLAFRESLNCEIYRASEVATWCIRLPNLYLNEAIVCYINSPSQPFWRLWQPKTIHENISDEPLLHIVSTSRGYGPRLVYLLFNSRISSKFDHPRDLLPRPINLTEIFTGSPIQVLMSGINVIDSLLELQMCENEELKNYVHQFNTDMSDYDALSGKYRLDDHGKVSLVKYIPEAPIVPEASTNIDQRFNLVLKHLVANAGSTKTVFPVRILDSPTDR